MKYYLNSMIKINKWYSTEEMLHCQKKLLYSSKQEQDHGSWNMEMMSGKEDKWQYPI